MRPEADVHVELPDQLRILSFVGTEHAVDYAYGQWYVAAALGYRLKPITRPHAENIDRDKEYSFLFGGGYEFLRTDQTGKVKKEGRIVIEVTPGVRPLPQLLLRDRNRVEFRWVNGTYSTTYRNMASAEVDSRIHDVRFTPIASVEMF